MTEAKNITNVYQRLNEARLRFHKTPLKKTGYNKHSNYYYFELGDFIPTAMEIFHDVGLAETIDYGVPCGDISIALMTIYNVDNPEERITFQTPLVYANLPKAQEIQSLGATHTYTRRYLWVTVLEIVENDVVDSLPQQEQKKGVHPYPDQFTQKDQENLDYVIDLVFRDDWTEAAFYISQLGTDEKAALWSKLTKGNNYRGVPGSQIKSKLIKTKEEQDKNE